MAVLKFCAVQQKALGGGFAVEFRRPGRYKGFPIRLGQAAQKLALAIGVPACSPPCCRMAAPSRGSAKGGVCAAPKLPCSIRCLKCCWGAQQSPCAGAQGVGGLGPGGGVGHAGCKILRITSSISSHCSSLAASNSAPASGVSAPKSQCVTPEGGQQIHSRGGELLRRKRRRRGAGRAMTISALAASAACTRTRSGRIGTPPLHRAAAHANSNALSTCRPHRRNLGRVAVVEGVIFGDNACGNP